MQLLERNEEILQKKDAELFFKYQEKKKIACEHIRIIENDYQEKIMCYVSDGGEWRLNSIYNPIQAAEIYAERYEDIKDYAVVCMFGLSDGCAVREFLKKCNGTQNIILFEPAMEIFVQAMKYYDLYDIIDNPNVYLIVDGMNENTLRKVFDAVVNFQNRELMMQCTLPNYDIIFSEQCANFVEQMVYYSRMEAFMHLTEIKHGKKMIQNILNNMNRVMKESSVKNLYEYFIKMDLEEIPAIIVSAGPSLDKNIDELKKAEGKAFIIGVDSALKALMRHNIKVDMAVTVDFNKNPDVFADDRIFDIPCVISVSALPLVFQKSRARLFCEQVAGFEAYHKILQEMKGIELGELETGGSVATDALSLAIDLGFKNIVLIGQDLAFTGGKGHVSGFEKTEEANKEHVKSRTIVQVEAQDGSMIDTDIQMESYLRWFEMRIDRAKDKAVFYNATEGGAKIAGTIQMPLRQVIEEHCVTEFDFAKLIAEVPYLLTEEEQKRFAKELLKGESHMVELEKELKSGIEAYHTLIRLERLGKQTLPEYTKAVKVISRVNKLEETERYIEMVKLYAKIAEADVANDIYVAEDLSVIEIAERGIQLLEAYLKGIELCKEDLKNILAPALITI